MQMNFWIIFTILFISLFLVLNDIFVFISGEHKLSVTSQFGGHRPCSWGNMTLLNCRVTTRSKCHVSLWVGPPYPESWPYHVLGAMGCVDEKIQQIWFVTWSRNQCVTWLCDWGSLILSHHTAKFGVHRTFFICHKIAILKCHLTFWVGSSRLKSPPC